MDLFYLSLLGKYYSNYEYSVYSVYFTAVSILGYLCHNNKCVPTINVNTNDDCPEGMQLTAVGSKCEFTPCSPDLCKLPWHRCTQTNSLGFYICAPIPVCTTNAGCKETELCIENHCVEVCPSGKCTGGLQCTDNLCKTIPSCIPKRGLYHCDHGKVCNDKKGCIDIECYLDQHCVVGNCYMGKCIETFSICNDDFDCLPGEYCEENYAGYKLCTPTPSCKNKMCPKGTKCSRFGQTCIPIIPPILEEDCPRPMHSVFDKFLDIKICELTKCNDDRDCLKGLKCNLKKGVCEIKITYIGCRTDKQCSDLEPNKRCILGICTSEPSCRSGSCPPICLDAQGCPPGLSCINNTCTNPCPLCPVREIDCSEAEPFKCKNPTVCMNKKCKIPTNCISTDHCPCFGDGGDCQQTCDNSALVCSKMGMICMGRKCEFPYCARDSQCPGQYCMNNRCTPAKECTTSSENCVCFENTCLNEITLCPNCPNGYECYEGRFCVPTGVRCSSNYHCPEHMKCKDGFCKTFQCQSDNGCSFGRRCGRNGNIYICVPDVNSILPICTSSASCSLGTRCNKTCVHPDHTPCPIGTRYYEGECQTSCRDDCPQGFSCIDSTCQRVPTKKCSERDRFNNLFGCQPDIWCYDDRNCPVPTFCDLLENQCVNFCNNSRPCTEGFHCNNTVCLIDTSTECDYYGRCPPGKVCNRISKKCDPACFSDTDCKKKQKCIDMTCTDQTNCKNCPNLQYCKKGVCTNIGCLTHSDCQPWERCKMGVCYKITFCKTDFNCLSDQFCYNGVCIDFPKCNPQKCPEGSRCVRYGDVSVCIVDVKCKNRCFVGAQCEKNICTPHCGKEACKLDEYCENDKCRPPTTCTTKEDCSKNYACANQLCILNTCKNINDCPPRYICENGMCVYKQCLSDDDCESSEFCKQYLCEVIKCFTNADCRIPSSVCSNGFCSRCARNQVLEKGLCKNPPSCRIDEDCPIPMICKRNQCSFCSEDIDCKSPRVCQKLGYSGVARCWDTPIINICYTSQDCDSGQVCINKKCASLCDCFQQNNPTVCDPQQTCQKVDGAFCACVDKCEVTCRAPGKQCKDNVCISTGCTRDFQCPVPLICSNGECIPPQICKCGPLDNCIQGVCMRETLCKTKNCTAGYHCQKLNTEDSICMPDVICTRDIDCPELMKCQGGICIYSGCRTDNQCSAYRKCKNNVCIPRPRCFSDQGCDEEQKCKFGFCSPPCDGKCENGLECIGGSCQE